MTPVPKLPGGHGIMMISCITTPLIVVSVVFPFLAAVSICLRLLAKRWNGQAYHADDWWIIATWFMTVPMSILFCVFGGLSGVDAYDVDFLQGMKDAIKVSFLAGCFFSLPLASVKISVLLFYKRIFEISEKLVMCTWVAIVVIAVWGVIFTIFTITAINPVSAIFELEGVLAASNVRWNMRTLGLAQVGSSIALDIIVLCFPLPIVFRMLLSPKKKLMIFGIFWLGAFCCIAAIVRGIVLEQSLRSLTNAQETVARQSTQYIFMLIEPNCSIIAACLPCYGPLLARTRRHKSAPNTLRETSGNGTPDKGSWGSGTHQWLSFSRQRSHVQLEDQLELPQASQADGRRREPENVHLRDFNERLAALA